jgi:hypothetical protein
LRKRRGGVAFQLAFESGGGIRVAQILIG